MVEIERSKRSIDGFWVIVFGWVNFGFGNASKEKISRETISDNGD